MALPDQLQYAKSKDTKEYPLPAFYFSVIIGDETRENTAKGSFTEVSGLTQEVQTLDYRDGFDKTTIPRKIPGMPKYSNVTLKRGVFHENLEFQKWVNDRQYNEIQRKLVTISLKDNEGQSLIVWKLSNAYPVKLEGPTMKSDSSEIAFESIELVHEGLTVEHVSKA